MSSPESASITGLFIAGLLASLHCAGMCGPLACAACGLGKSNQSSNIGTFALRRIAGYQLTRVFAYTLLGAVAGAVGSQPLSWLGLSGKPLVLWAAIALIVGAVLVETLIPLRRKIAAAEKSCKKLRPALSRGSWAVGLATPLLPCGVLYSALGVAALSGGPVIGASLMAAFGLGTIPLLAIAQVQWARWSPALGTSAARYLRLGIAVLFAAALAWRGGLFTPDSAIAGEDGEPFCPMCAKEEAAKQ